MRYIYRFEEVDAGDTVTVGQIGANLAELNRSGVPILPGFIISTDAYRYFLRENNLATKISHLFTATNLERHDEVIQTASQIKKLLQESPLPEELLQDIFKAHRSLSGTLSDSPLSVTASSTDTSDEIGKHSISNGHRYEVIGDTNLVLKIKNIWSSQFDASSLLRMKDNPLHDAKAVVVQKDMQSRVSGVMMTADPVTSDVSKIIIEAVLGDHLNLPRNHTAPDHIEIDKNTLEVISEKTSIQTIIFRKRGEEIAEELITKKAGNMPKLSRQEIISLASIGKKIESYFVSPLSLEWAIDNNQLFLLQIKKLDLNLRTQATQQSTFLDDTPKLALTGFSAAQGIATGPVQIISTSRAKVEPGSVVVLKHDILQLAELKKAVAVILESGSRMSPTSISCRLLGIPAVIGTKDASSLLLNGVTVTVNGTKAEIYTKIIKKTKSEKTNGSLTATKVFTIVTGRDSVDENLSDGVGLLQAEPWVHSLAAHPKKLLGGDRKVSLTDEIASYIGGYCSIFSPRPVMYRSTDLISTDMRKLPGGHDFEPIEPHPHLGLRGAARYLADPLLFQEELQAIKLARRPKNAQNLWLLLPYIRTIKELSEIKNMIANAGLYRSASFKIFVSVDVPSTVIQIEKFLSAGIDGVSINLDSLRRLLLGTDPQNAEVTHLSNYLDDSVLWALEKVITAATRNHLACYLTSEHTPLNQDILEKVVKWGVTGVTVQTDQVEQTKKSLTAIEKNLFS